MNDSLDNDMRTDIRKDLRNVFADVVSAGGPIDNGRSGDLRRSIEQRRSKSRRTLGVIGGAALAASLVVAVAAYSVMQSDRRSTDESVLVGVTPRTPLQTAGLIAGWLPEGTFQLRVQSLSGVDPGFEERALFGSADDGLEIVRYRSTGSVDPNDETDPFEIAPDIPDPDRPRTSESSGQLPDGSVYRWFDGPNELQSTRYLVRAIGRDRSLDELLGVLNSLDGSSIAPSPLGLGEADRETRPADRWPDSYVWEYTDETDDGFAFLLRPSTYESKRQSWLRQTHVKQDEEIRGRSYTRSPDGTRYTVSGEEPTGHRLTGLFLHTSRPDVVRLLNELRPATDEEWKDQLWDPAEPVIDGPPATAPPPPPPPYIATWLPSDMVEIPGESVSIWQQMYWVGYGTPNQGLMVIANDGWLPTAPGKLVDGVLVRRLTQLPTGALGAEAGHVLVVSNLAGISQSEVDRLAARLSEEVPPNFEVPTKADDLVSAATSLSRATEFREPLTESHLGFWRDPQCIAKLIQRDRETEEVRRAWLSMVGQNDTALLGILLGAGFPGLIAREVPNNEVIVVQCFRAVPDDTALRIADGMKPNPDYKP
jgi:hypothetical protein